MSRAGSRELEPICSLNASTSISTKLLEARAAQGVDLYGYWSDAAPGLSAATVTPTCLQSCQRPLWITDYSEEPGTDGQLSGINVYLNEVTVGRYVARAV